MMKLLQYFIIGLLMIFLIINFSCKKEEPIPENSNKIEIGTTTIDSISYYTSTISTSLTSTGGNQITQHGHCWSIDKKPTIENNHTKLGSKNDAGTFISELDSLEPATAYYVRAYTSYALGTVYGEIKEFKTINTGKPVVTTSEVQNITLNAAECGGVVVNDSGLVVTARGVCWNTTGSPTLDDCIAFTSDSIGTGNFISHITNLQEGTNYFISAYATNEKGTSYGEVKSFITIPLELPEVNTGAVTNITINSAQCSGNAINNGNGTITARGICWNTTDDFDLENCLGFTDNGTGLGEFTGNITELTYGTIYFTKAYATNEKGTAYGEVKSFETVEIGFPVLTTIEVTNITTNSAQCGGTITDAGNGNVVARGVCWSTSNDPILDDCIGFTTDGEGLGNYNSLITNLSSGLNYYVCAYATNEKGTSYGEVKTFQTISGLPVVSTSAVTNIATNSAVCGGIVTDEGNGSVTSRGVCWSNTSNPTLEDCIDFTIEGAGTGSFTSDISNLDPGTDYYVVAYAVNEEGTGYGLVRQFTTIGIALPTVITYEASEITTTTAISGGEVTDDGNGTVTARGVCWSTSVNPTIADLHTTNGSGTGNFVSQLTGLTPNMIYYVRAYATNEEGTAYGNQVSFTTITDILPSVTTTEATNITQNSASSGGNVTSNGGGIVSTRGVCWSTSVNPTMDDFLTTNGSGTGSFVSELTDLMPNTIYYVKAYATNEAGTAYGGQVSFTTLIDIILPSVTTTETTNITPNSATSGGNVTSNGGGAVSARGVCWSTSVNPTINDPHTTNGSGTGSFVSQLTDLTPNTIYYVRAYATNEAGTAYGNQVNFSTLDFEDCGEVSYGGKIYPTVIIGSQCWLKKNLNVGSMINGTENQQNNSTIEKYCLDNQESYCDDYGGLYQWDEAMQYVTTAGAQGICPDGWHIPTTIEWNELVNFLGGSSVAGGKMKEAGNAYWTPPNTGATNSSGLTCLPGSYRDYPGGSFYEPGYQGNFWSSWNNGSTSAWYRRLFFNEEGVYRGYCNKEIGFSVRCLQD